VQRVTWPEANAHDPMAQQHLDPRIEERLCKPKPVGNKRSEALKKKGNDAFQKGDYAASVAHYTDAMVHAPQDHVLYSNRSFALFQLKDYRAASRDAMQCIKLAKSWSKGYYRLGLAMSGLGMFTKALEAFSIGLVAEPENRELRMAFEKAREAAAEQSLSTLTWHQHPVVSSAAESPKQRCTHTLVPIGSRVFCFGGFGQGVYDDVSVISADTLTLTTDVVAAASASEKDNPVPTKRSSHTAVAYGESMVVFGGFDGTKEFMNDVWVLDATTGKWRQPIIRGTSPIPRCSHSAVVSGHEMFVFGGMTETKQDGARRFNDVPVLDLRDQRWVYPDIHGASPHERNSHSMTLVGGNTAVMFGGCCGAEMYFNDVHTLDLSSLTWSQPSVSGHTPQPRMGHAAASLGSRMYVHGGLVIQDKSYRADTYILDTERWSWVMPELAGSVPMPRVGHAMVPIRGGKILSYGGDGGPSLGILRDVWVADTDLEVAQLRSNMHEAELERVQMLETMERLKIALRKKEEQPQPQQQDEEETKRDGEEAK
jgi:N-acetylneuraminic acid mutarotase